MNWGPLGPEISPIHLNTRVSNATSAQREQNPAGFVPNLFPNSKPLVGAQDIVTLESETRKFAEQLRRQFADQVRHDPRAFKKRVLRLIRRQLPPGRGRPRDPKTEEALELIRQGKTVRQVLRVQVRGFDQLDTYGRYLAEKALRQALARRQKERD